MENKPSRKRGCSVLGEEEILPKKLCIDTSICKNEFKQDLTTKLTFPCQSYRSVPYHLIKLMYRLDLSLHCLHRLSLYRDKYPSLSVVFGDSQVDTFNNIVLYNDKKSIHVQIENVDTYMIENKIDYSKLFAKRQQIFSVHKYFDNFVKLLISKSGSSLRNIKCLIIFTNSDLDLTLENKLKQGHSRTFYPFEFEKINIEQCDILKDFFIINNKKEGSFYQFSKNKLTQGELLKRLKFTPAMQSVLKERKFSQEKVKQLFLDKLLFVVNQSNRKSLNSSINIEIEKNTSNRFPYGYTELKTEVINRLIAQKKHEIHNYRILYSFSLLLFFLHGMFLNKKIFSITYLSDIANDITIHYKDKRIFVATCTPAGSIGYSQLFSSKAEAISINKKFALFINELNMDVKYFIIYTFAELDLTKENMLKKGKSKNFYPLKFSVIDCERKKYKTLKQFSCINDGCVYQFSQEEETRNELLNLLKLPPSFLNKNKEEKLCFNENEIKGQFLDKLIFMVNQPNFKDMNNVVRNEVFNSKVPYNFKELHEIMLRWLESHEIGPITKEIMDEILRDIRNKHIYQEVQIGNIYQEIKFVKNVVREEGTPAFYNFLIFLVKGEGKTCFEVLKKNKISLSNLSCILGGTKMGAPKYFKELYNLWFDEQGNKTQYLKTLERNKIYISNTSGILSYSRSNAANAFKEIYDLWFDEQGNKTQYLKALDEEGIFLSRFTSILNGAGVNAAKSYNELFDVWFGVGEQKNKPQCFKILNRNGIHTSCVSSILSGAGVNAAKCFEGLYGLWFDEQGNKTQYLETLSKEKINLHCVSCFLSKTTDAAPEIYKDLYDLWFDEQGNKSHYLKTLEKENINLSTMSNILTRSRSNVVKSFKGLYCLWFDDLGNKTQYLKTLEKEGINLTSMSSILHGAGVKAMKAFKELYDLWFDKQGNKTQYLETMEREKISLYHISHILNKAGAKAPNAFKELYDLWFDELGNKTQYLEDLEEKGMSLSNICHILNQVGAKAPKAFKNLYDLWINGQTIKSKSQYLEALKRDRKSLM